MKNICETCKHLGNNWQKCRKCVKGSEYCERDCGAVLAYMLLAVLIAVVILLNVI